MPGTHLTCRQHTVSHLRSGTSSGKSLACDDAKALPNAPLTPPTIRCLPHHHTVPNHVDTTDPPSVARVRSYVRSPGTRRACTVIYPSSFRCCVSRPESNDYFNSVRPSTIQHLLLFYLSCCSAHADVNSMFDSIYSHHCNRRLHLHSREKARLG